MFRIHRGEIKQRARQIVGRGVEPEAPQAKDRRRLLDCPHRAAVIAQRIVVAVIGRERPDAPSAEHVGREQPADDRGHVGASMIPVARQWPTFELAAA